MINTAPKDHQSSSRHPEMIITTLRRRLFAAVFFLALFNFSLVECEELKIEQVEGDPLVTKNLTKAKTTRQETDAVFQFWSSTTTSERTAHNSSKKQPVEASTPGKITIFVDNVETKAHLVTTSPKNTVALAEEKPDSDNADDISRPFDEEDDYDEAEVRTEFDENEEKDMLEAAEYGLKKMKELYEVEEPKLYKLGLKLEEDNPARLVATFNWQTNEAAELAKFGYATLQAENFLKRRSPDEAESRISGENAFHRPSLSKDSPLRQQCPLRGDPRCPPASKRYRTHDGTCNNLRKLRWGAALTAVQRFLPPVYSDGVQSPRRGPSPRAVTAAVHLAGDFQRSTAPVTHMLMQWGQMLDHDITAASQARAFNGSVPRCCRNGGRDFVPLDLLHPDCLPISVPEDDPFYGPLGVKCLDFIRSSPAPRVECQFGWREQMNQVTAYIDGSPIYGSSVKQSDKLRLFRSGLLQYGRMQARKPVLPQEEDDEEALCRGGAVDSSCFKAGDGRVNEHPGLVAMHIVWLRKHNRIALELAHLNPHWSDEKVYQETRKIIGAFIQHITYNEFLPIVLGSEVMRLFDLNLQTKSYYKGYNTKVNPSPANSFGAAAFRFGHSLVQDSFVRFDRFHRPLPNNVPLHEELSNPANLKSFGAVDRLILGLTNQPSQKRDEIITPELTNHLFQSGSFPFGMDLASINIQRGRDHGLPPYIEWREPCGLTMIDSWSDLTAVMSVRTVQRLQKVYRSVEDIDLFTGGMAEKPVISGLVGPTFACIIAQQFSNLRRGDRFWYENGGFDSSFTPAQLQQIRKITLSQVLCQTMENIDTLQPFVFLSSDNSRNSRISCDNDLMNSFDLLPWTERISDFDNNISPFDRTNRPNIPSPRPFPPFDNDNDLSETQTLPTLFNTIQPTTDDTSKTLDDKLDITEKDITTQDFITTPMSSNPEVLIDDKLDFESKTVEQNFSIPNITTNDTENKLVQKRDTRKQTIKTNTNTNKTQNQESPSKTYDFLLDENGELPAFFGLFSTRRTTTVSRPIVRPKPTPDPIIYSQDEPSSTTNNADLTYLINIVPLTTPQYKPAPQKKQTVKITIQQTLTPSTQTNGRPVYNNNRLEYIPITDDTDLSYSRPQIVNNRPYNINRPLVRPTYSDSETNSYNNNNDQITDTQSSYSSYNRPKPTTDTQSSYSYGRPKPITNRPSNNYYDSYTTEYNPYGLTTFTHIQTTQKPDLFNRPIVQSETSYNDYNNYNKPTATQNINPRPETFQNVSPVSTGITIYIDNKPIIRPLPSDTGPQTFTDSTYSSSSSQNTFTEDDSDNVPIYAGQVYDKPASNKPEYPKPFPFGQYGQSNDNDRPDSSSDNIQTTNGNTYNIQHKDTSTLSHLNRLPKPKPNVNLHLTSEYGHQQRPDISIVLNNVRHKSTVITTSAAPVTFRPLLTSTEKPVKIYYVGNVMHKQLPNEERGLATEPLETKHVILKENYNNKWTPNREEQEFYYSNSNFSTPSSEENKKVEPVVAERKNTFDSSALKSIDSKNKDKVFFDVIPSENSATRWVIYNEMLDEKPQLQMSQLFDLNITDSQVSSELPKPMGFFRIKHRRPSKVKQRNEN